MLNLCNLKINQNVHSLREWIFHLTGEATKKINYNFGWRLRRAKDEWNNNFLSQWLILSASCRLLTTDSLPSIALPHSWSTPTHFKIEIIHIFTGTTHLFTEITLYFAEMSYLFAGITPLFAKTTHIFTKTSHRWSKSTYLFTEMSSHFVGTSSLFSEMVHLFSETMRNGLDRSLHL